MTPFYQEQGIVIHNGDCRDLMPQLPDHDLVIIDPPFGMSWRSNYRATKHASIIGDDKLPRDLIDMAIAKAKRAAYVFCRWDNLADMPPPRKAFLSGAKTTGRWAIWSTSTDGGGKRYASTRRMVIVSRSEYRTWCSPTGLATTFIQARNLWT